MSGKKPTLKPGEFTAPVVVHYDAEGAPGNKGFEGDYTVELGAEFYNDGVSSYSRHTRRYVRVNGTKFDIYAMVRNTEPHSGKDRKILRDEDELRIRAVEWYIHGTLRPAKEEAKRQEEQRQRDLAMDSTDNWTLEIGKDNVIIQPLGIKLWATDGQGPNLKEFRERRIQIMQRVFSLIKEHGL